MANGTWKIARNRSSAQLPLAVFAVLAIVVVLIGKAQSSLFDSARTKLSDWTAPLLKTVNVPVAVVSRWVGSAGEIFSVYQENLRLKEENARLRQWHSAALVLDDRVKRYQLLLNAVPDPTLTTVTARVIGRSSKPFLETMILDAGKVQNVKPGQAVLDARGMIGRIFLSGERTSWVILLTDLNSRIPVVIQPGNIQAMIAGDNTAAPTVETLAQGASLKPGMQVLTSGDGGLIPPGLPIGSLAADGDRFRVALLADAGTADDVQIVDFKSPPDKPPAVTKNDLPATAAGLQPEAPPTDVPQAPILAPVLNATSTKAPTQNQPLQKPGPAAAPNNANSKPAPKPQDKPADQTPGEAE
jgi:rod shape-determining protein MreC